MSTMEILLFILGMGVFIISFIIPDRKKEVEDVQTISEDEIRKLVEDEYERTRSRLTDLTDETISYSMEKAERSLEKLSNEKILALGEYSDTVMNQISTNHKETVFLHDMLTQNKNELTILLGQAIKDAKDASDLSSEALSSAQKAAEDSKEALGKSKAAVDNSIVAEEKMINARKYIEGADSQEKASKKSSSEPKAVLKSENEIQGQMSILDFPEIENHSFTEAYSDTEDEAKKKPAKKTRKTSTKKKSNVELKFDSDDNAENNNEKILKLHKMGKSNVAIAKELGLGVGEVQLVIDLFK